MLELFKYTLQGIISQKTARFLKKLDSIQTNGIKDKRKFRKENQKYQFEIGQLYQALNYDEQDSNTLLSNITDYKSGVDLLNLLVKINNLGLNKYINISKAKSLVNNEEKLNTYIKFSKIFKDFGLNKDNQGDVGKLLGYADVTEENLDAIVNVLIKTKNAGYPVSQDVVFDYFTANRPDSEDVEAFGKAWLAIQKTKNEIPVSDLKQVMKFGRKPDKFVANYNKIVSSDIDVSYQKFKTFSIPQDDIPVAIDTILKLRKLDIYLDFDVVYGQVSSNAENVKEAISYLHEFNNIEFNYFSYEDLLKFKNSNIDLLNLLQTYLYNRENKVLDEKIFFEKFKKIVSTKNKVDDLSPFTFLKAIEIEFKRKKDDKKSNLSEEEKNEIIEKVFNEYLVGLNVFSILSFQDKAKSHKIDMPYGLAKAFSQQKELPLNEVLEKALNPFMLYNNEEIKDEDGTITEKPVDFHVVTKDHVEIIINVQIQVVLILERYFSGSGKDVLFHRVYAILLNEIQQRYNHDEIIVNIEKISNNVLYELNKESKEIFVQRIPEKQMKRITPQTHHEEHHKEKHTEKEHKEEHHKNEHRAKEHTDNQTHNNDNNFNKVSKYKPLKILIPKIEFVKASFKEYEIIKEQHKHHIEAMHLELENVKTDIKVKEAWTKGENLKYKFLNDDNLKEDEHHHHHNPRKLDK